MAFPEVEQLQQARRLAMENNPTQLLPKVLETAASLYASQSAPPALKLELARFFAQLLLQVLSDPQFPSSEKPFVAQQHLGCLYSVLRGSKDSTAYKYSVLAFAAVYPLLFDLVAKTSSKETWELMQQMKQFIVQRWNSVYPEAPRANENNMFADDARGMGVRLATAKFIAEIVIVHTSRSSSSRNDVISISSVPEGHPVISNKPQIEAEAKKLLDLLLNYLIEEPIMVAPLFSGVLNCLSFVMRQRPQATMRILGALLKFNVDAKFQQDGTSTLHYRLSKRFVERSYKNFVQFGLKNQLIKSQGSMAPLHAKLSKISQTLHVIGEETRSKGIMNYEETAMENKMKDKDKQKCVALRRRQQQVGGHSPAPQPMTLQTPSSVEPPVPNDIQLLSQLQKYTMSKNIPNFFNASPIAIDNSYCAVYSLMNSNNSGQDVSKLSQDVMVKLCSEAFYNTDTTKLISGLSIVASRYTDLINKSSQSGNVNPTSSASSSAANATAAAIADASNSNGDSRKRKLEPNAQPTSKRLKSEEILDEEEELDDGPVDLQRVAPLSPDDKMRHVQRVVAHIMALKDSDETPGLSGTLAHDSNPLMKIKLLQWDGNSWLDLLTRLAARGLTHNEEMSDYVRSVLHDQFLEDINGRVGMVLEWLSEEWYSELQLQSADSEGEGEYPTYDKWSLKLLSSLVPYLENQHRRLFIRLMSELPRVTQAHIDAVRPICLDPARASLGFQTLKFLVMFRPPAKPKVHILLQQLRREDPSTASSTDAILNKYYTS